MAVKVKRQDVEHLLDSSNEDRTGMICSLCGMECPRRGFNQLYCESCSEAKAAERRDRWRKSNPAAQRKCQSDDGRKRRSRAVETGLRINEIHRWSVEDVFPSEDGMAWVRRLAIPHNRSLSKNNIWTPGRGGHVFLRKESREAKEFIAASVAEAVADVEVIQNKVWVSILVQKERSQSDAINVIDLVCDGIKVGLGVDDRWFSLKTVDWQIIKRDPEVFIGIGQEPGVDSQTCSHCGRILPFDSFWKSKSRINGIGTACKECMKTRN